MDYAVRMKDRIFKELNEAAGNKFAFLKRAEQILTAIMECDGVWIEANYSYKAIEIGQRIIQQCNEYLPNCSFDLQVTRCEQIRVLAQNLIRHFETIQR